MKNNTLLSTVLLLYILITSTAYAQTKNTKGADYFLGTWFGMIYRGAIDTVRLDNSMFMWRIHKVDMNKGQIEMTEIFYYASMTDSDCTEKPRMAYPARIDNKSLFIQLTDRKADTTFTLKLSQTVIDGNPFLQSEPGKLRFKNQEVGYLLGKRDNDTTNRSPKDQQGQVTVIVQPPPPVEPKKQ